MNISTGKLFLLGFILDLILLLVHAYFVSYIVKDPTAWFMFLTDILLILGLIGFGVVIITASEKEKKE